MGREDIPNLISVLRIFLSVPVVWMLLEQRFDIALILFAIAGVSDGLDGFLAKHYGWQSRLGGLLDPMADKILLVSSYVSLALLGLIPVWLMLLVILRDLVIVTGGARGVTAACAIALAKAGGATSMVTRLPRRHPYTAALKRAGF